MKTSSLPFLFCIFALLLLSPLRSAANPDIENSVPHQPVFHIPLRVHLGNSDRAPKKWLPILDEINFIWFSQAGICFEMHTVSHDEELENGLDLWFESTIPNWNGYFTDIHDMHVRDDPDLRPAQHPAGSSAARTAAHELGHALSLGHKQNSDDNLMRSKTYGWQLHKDEITQARTAAGELTAGSSNGEPCSFPAIHTDT
jgi:hypothetical protein